MKTTGDRIKYVRESLQLIGEDFGKQLNVAKSSVSNWEKNNRTPDAEMLVKIANLGNVTVDFLLGRTDNPDTKVYKTNIDGKNYTIGVSREYPHNLTPEEVDKLILKLKESRFDIDGLIEEIKNKKEE